MQLHRRPRLSAIPFRPLALFPALYNCCCYGHRLSPQVVEPLNFPSGCDSPSIGLQRRGKKMEDFTKLREAVDKAELVDAHAHSIVALDTTMPFTGCFCEATGVEALSFAAHSISFKRSLKEIAELYGCDSSLQSIEEFRRSSGLDAITSMCFKAARISTVLIDDRFELDKIHDIQWHQNFVPSVGRILRIERLAEQILDEGSPDGGAWTLTLFIEAYVQHLKSLAGKIVGLKSIAAYRSGLEINTNVKPEEAENGLNDVLQAGSPVRLTNKKFLDHLFTCTLEVAVFFDLPIQIHTGFGDKDLDLRLSNPLHLRKVLEDSRFSKSRLVLLHAFYPFSKEASYLASVYPQLHVHNQNGNFTRVVDRYFLTYAKWKLQAKKWKDKFGRSSGLFFARHKRICLK